METGKNSSIDEMACIYSAAILADDDVPITSEKINAILKAAGVEVEAIWPTLYAKALQNINVKEFITNIGSRGCAGAAAGSASEPMPSSEKEESKAQEEKKEDTETDSDDDMGLNLFD